MSIERIKTGIDYQSIAAAYGYKPIPEGFQPIPVINISIDWQTGANQRQVRQRAAMQNFDTAALERSPVHPRRNIALLDEGIIPTDKGSLRLITQKWKYENGEEFLRLHLIDNEACAEVGSYLTARRGNAWDMHDRITSEGYRGKGVASQMIKATENCIQAFANNTGQDQEIFMEAGQLPVLSVFLKEGYEVVDEDKQRFSEVMNKLEVGDPKYVLASCESDFRSGNEERKTWYVFEREIYERLGDEIWDIAYEQLDDGSFIMSPTDRNYMKHGIRFKLRKKIEAKSADIAGEAASVHERITISCPQNDLMLP